MEDACQFAEMKCPPCTPPATPSLKDACRANAVEFFCKPQCACNHSKKFKNCLCLSACTFTLPAALLFQHGNTLIGGCAAALFLTSVAYHSTHDPRLRAVDVLMVWLTGGLGILQCIADILTSGPNVWLLLSLLGIVAVATIDALPYFYTTYDGQEVIALPWHVTVHLLCTASLLCLASGEHTAAGGAVAAHTFWWDPWSASAVVAVAVGAGVVPAVRSAREVVCNARAAWSEDPSDAKVPRRENLLPPVVVR